MSPYTQTALPAAPFFYFFLCFLAGFCCFELYSVRSLLFTYNKCIFYFLTAIVVLKSYPIINTIAHTRIFQEHAQIQDHNSIGYLVAWGTHFHRLASDIRPYGDHTSNEPQFHTNSARDQLQEQTLRLFYVIRKKHNAGCNGGKNRRNNSGADFMIRPR